MTRLLAIVVISLAVPGLLLADAGQTDWSGGGGIPGPVAAWGNRFNAADGASWLAVTGQVALSSSPLASPVEHVLSAAYSGTIGVAVGDIDNDGDTDIVGTADASGAVRLWRNQGGDPLTWTEEVVADPPGAAGVDLADLDGDGRLDVVLALIDPRNKIVWRQNLGGEPITWGAWTVEGSWGNTWEMETGDVNGDGFVDVMATKWSPGEVAWWQNSGTEPIVWTKRQVAPSLGGAHSVRGADLDGDGDMDLAVAAGLANKILVYWSDGSNPPVWTAQVLDSTAVGARSVWPGDIDGDGDLDLAAIWWDNHIAWWRNDGGSPIVWTRQVVCETAYGGHGICLGDMNGDGRLDVLGASINADKLAWYENGGGSPTTWTEHIVSAGLDGCCTVRAADLDLDGDLEAVSAAYNAHSFSWWKATEFDSAGEITSSVLDSGEGEALGTMDWTSIVPSGTSLRFQIRSSDDPDSLGAWSEDITAPGCLPAIPGRYLQYRALLGTTDPAVSPVLQGLSLTYAPAGTYPAGGERLACRLTAQPSPFAQCVTVHFALGAAQRVGLAVFDVAGRRVRDLSGGWFPAGDHQVEWDGLDARGARLSSGVYWLRLDSGDLRETREIVLIR